MMRTVEALLVIIILGGAYVGASTLVTLPSPGQTSPTNLNMLALTTLQELDSRYDLSSAAFQPVSSPQWGLLQIALSASLPANVVYNLTVYNINAGLNGASLYTPVDSFSNAANLGAGSDGSSYLVASSNVTYVSTPQVISTDGVPDTLYILNCSDTAGWWITGYTPSSLAQQVYSLLSPYFKTTIMVQNTNQLGQILNDKPLQGETINNAIVVNTCGEAVPIPTQFSTDTSGGSYYPYDYLLGTDTRIYNWTWVSIVGYPFYYVTNTGFLTQSGTQNGFGIYGMYQVGSPGLNAFLEGLDNLADTDNGTWIAGQPQGLSYLTSQAQSLCNYYGLYPSPYQTSTRALPASILSDYNLVVATGLFNTAIDVSGHNLGLVNPGAVYRHWVSVKTNYEGGFLALGMARIPDIRLAALGILCNYQPIKYSSVYSAAASNRVVVLQLGVIGGG